MSQLHEPFVYAPLSPGEIRVLCPTFRGDEVIWSLNAIQIRDQARQPAGFDALSYTWGDLSHTFPLVCNGQTLQIHENLKNALPYLARRDSTLPLWIDAVCINQSDDVEKFAQISMMRRIYQKATQVWVWLGLAHRLGDEAVALLPHLAKVGEEFSSWSVTQWVEPKSVGLPHITSPLWEAIFQLINNEWYRRLWIVQEVALAQRVRVLYGEHEIQWGLLDKAVEYGGLLGFNLREEKGKWTLPRGFTQNHYVFIIRNVSQKPNPEIEIPWPDRIMRLLTITARSHHCSQPQDRVFGILGIADADEVEKLALGHESSVVELYTKLTHFLFSNVGIHTPVWWHILWFATSPNKRPGLPSWCPDYHCLDVRKALTQNLHEVKPPPGWQSSSGYFYNASRAEGWTEQGGNIRELTVRGKIFDSIQRAHPQFPDVLLRDSSGLSWEQMKAGLLDFRQWERDIAAAVLGFQPDTATPPYDEPTTVYANHEKGAKLTLDDYWRTLIGNQTPGKYWAITYNTFCEFRSSLNEFMIIAERLMEYDPDTLSLYNECAFGQTEQTAIEEAEARLSEIVGLDTQCWIFWSKLRDTLNGNRLFSTAEGRFGYSSAGIQDGDVICILNYSNSAHVLRRMDDGGSNSHQAYKIVGQAYIHGMMHGEVEDLAVEASDIVLI